MEVEAVTLVSNTYDALGRLQVKVLGNVDATTYAYNVRSWTTGISGSRFTENLYYTANTAGLPTFTPTYNGNIAGMQWSVPNESLGYNRAYTFGYDGLNRLTDANYCGFNGSVVAGTTGKYDEHMGFDKMGNFTGLTRYENGSLLNNLSFNYTGNQVKKVDNSVSPYISYGSEAFNDKQKIDTEYYYDQNGSTTADVNTGISTIQYNLLNLPDIIQFTAGHKNMYTYDASGRKLEAVTYTVMDLVNVPIGTISSLPDPSRYTKLTTDYVGNMIYENGVLKEILLPEGYYQGGVYYYYLKDHLGDNRVVINSSGTVIEKSHYYPSGMRFYPESTSNSAALPYRYNGKELEAMNGLNEYDYGARLRGAGLPIWTGVDPHAEKYYSISPYVYCSNNPVNAIDPDGKLVIFINGMHWGSGGKSEYWKGFDTKVMNRVSDHNSIYKDGSLGGWAPINVPSEGKRESSGYDQGKIDASYIISNITNDKGEIIQTIKIITHSMGGAFAKGYVKAILEYAHSIGITIPIIAFEADFAPYESSEQTAVKDPLMGPTLQYSHKEIIAGNKPEKGDAQQEDTSKDENQTHSIVDFQQQISTLPTGKYRFVDGKIVPY